MNRIIKHLAECTGQKNIYNVTCMACRDQLRAIKCHARLLEALEAVSKLIHQDQGLQYQDLKWIDAAIKKARE